jgi:hypothetical protein
MFYSVINAFRSPRLEPNSRFPSSSQKILTLFTYLLRFVLSRLELRYLAGRVIGRHSLPYVACLTVTLTEMFRVFLSLLRRVSGQKRSNLHTVFVSDKQICISLLDTGIR